jgi:phage baseplate assembly protein W
MASIGIQFPIDRTIDGGVFETTKTTERAIRTNLIFLLTTKRGHRVMRANLFSPLYDFIMENFDEISSDLMKEQLIEKIKEYIPQITVERIINTFQDPNTVSVKIVYSINNLGGIQDQVTVVFPRIDP